MLLQTDLHTYLFLQQPSQSFPCQKWFQNTAAFSNFIYIKVNITTPSKAKGVHVYPFITELGTAYCLAVVLSSPLSSEEL